MNEKLTGVEDRVLDRVRKLLRLASDERGNEHEAALAARRAAEIMEQHGLSTAVVEAGGGVGEGRTAREEGGIARGRAPWMPELMRAVAESCFCLCEVEFVTPPGDRQLRMVFRMFGRESAVAGAFALADYLKQTIWRLSNEAGVERPHYFRSGCAERLGERVRESHEMALANQRAEAERASREAAARAAHPGAAPAGTTLAVILEDYAAKEREANEELWRGLPPGTLAAERAAARADREARERRYQQLIKDGVDKGVAWNMVHMSMTLERAVEYEAEWQAREKARQAEPPPKEKRRTKADEARQNRQWRAFDRESRRRSDPSWVAGRERGDEVSLARQLRDRKDGRLR
jgi:hypothetical protein